MRTTIEDINQLFDPKIAEEDIKNQTMLLHACIAMMMRTFLDALISTKERIPDDKLASIDSYQRLSSHHRQNSYASVVQSLASIGKLGCIVAGVDPHIADAGFKIEETLYTAFKEAKKGEMESSDHLSIQVAKSHLDEDQENSRTLDHLKDKLQEMGNSVLNKHVESYIYRG